jgi:hypothetical protein
MTPIIGSREKKIQTLEARKKELLQRKNFTQDPADIARIEALLKDVEDLLKQYREPTTIRRRIRKTDEE